MRFNDDLYGMVEIPDFIAPLLHTKEARRLDAITQSVLPNELMPYGPISSRLEHGLGVCFLAEIVLKNNPELQHFRSIMPIASLYHDGGSPTFSHLSEPFLKKLTGMDHEMFLKEILKNSETEQILNLLGIQIDEIVDFVAGSVKPFAEVLNGSLDIDNLDNVGRYNLAAQCGAESFDALKIAASFRFMDGEWTLLDSCLDEVKKWQNARRAVYQKIYSKTHLSIAMVVYRAVEIAFRENELSKDFFFLDDRGGIDYLRNCNAKTASLIERVLRREWYEEVIAYAFSNLVELPNAMQAYMTAWDGRGAFADLLTHKLGIPEEQICVYAGKSRDSKKITLPFVSKDGGRRYKHDNHFSIYRLKVYIPPELLNRAPEIRALVEQLLKK